jgi:flagellar basal body rod protein FlgG
MAAQQTALDVIATNLSNVDTPGFRADRPEFASMLDDAVHDRISLHRA